MKFQLPERAFPPLVLSSYEERELIDETHRIVEATIAAQEQYSRSGRRIDSSQWKHFRTKEGMNVYRQRSVGVGSVGSGASKKLFDPLAVSHDDLLLDTSRSDAMSSSSSSWLPMLDSDAGSNNSHTPGGIFHTLRGATKTPSRRRAPQSTKSLDEHHAYSPSTSVQSTDNFSTTMSEHSWMEHQRKPAHVPGILAVGVVDGTLENAMYGVLTEDDASWRWKSSQINDKFDDARVLATIRGPTREDPFRFIGIKWFTKEHPSVLDSVVKRRDFLTIEAMGTTYDSSGQQLGYFLMHSVDIPRIPVLSDLDILRGKASFCFILRQASPSSIEVFVRGFSDPQGEMYEAVSLLLASESVLAAVKIGDFGHIKKLRWLMIQRRQQHQRENTLELDTETDPTTCTTCHKAVKRLGSLFQSSSCCQVCHANVCGKCVITKHITVDITVEGATQKPLPFCLACVIEAKNLNAWELASENVAQRQYNLLPADLFPTDARALETATLRRAVSAPRLPKPRSNSRIRSASHGFTQVPYPQQIQQQLQRQSQHPSQIPQPSRMQQQQQRRRDPGSALF